MTEQQQISRSQAWLESLRPKTLPLAFAAIIVGTALAWWQGYFNPLVALLALITAGLLQILSNLANDYGDAVKGSDKPDRIGPLRGMQKGVITQQQMKRALIVTVVLICLSGLALVAVACHTLADFVGFLVLATLNQTSKPNTIGRHPVCRIRAISVVRPIAVSAAVIMIGASQCAAAQTASGTNWLTAEAMTNPTMNQGTARPTVCRLIRAPRLSRRLNQTLTIKVTGIIISARVSLTIVAYCPAASLQEYAAATTEEVSLIAVPAHKPKPLSLKPNA